ncbi:unnamed protein product [Phaeothamnion confervicola]
MVQEAAKTATRWGPEEDIAHLTYKLSVINGVPHNPQFKEEVIRDLIANFETRDDDVFIVTYVKSGTTWTQQMLHLLLNDGVQGDKSYPESVPWLEAASTDTMLNNREAKGWSIERINNWDGRRFFKSHANAEDLPRGKAAGVRIVYVARNPKDVAVSLHHHARGKPDFGYDGDFGQTLHFFAEGRCENGDWFEHVLEWWRRAATDPDHILFLKYEDIVADAPTAIQRISTFLGIPTTPDLVARVIENSSIDSMKKNANANVVGHGHLRRGGSGGWRDVFSVRQSERFDALYRDRMAGSGLQFDFGEGLIM